MLVLLAPTAGAESLDVAAPGDPLPPVARLQLAEELAHSFQAKLLEAWYPRCVDDAAGGFLSGFNADWEPVGEQRKMVVTQARHVWTTARASEFLGGNRALRDIARHGYRFLRDVMWDEEKGGFHTLVSRNGAVLPNDDGKATKTAYGNAFAIYALAAFAEVTGEEAALELARRTFRWLEEHSHDPVHGGYYQDLAADGTPLARGVAGARAKDQNSSIHLLEAFTELYRIWPDPLLRERLEEMLVLVRDRMTMPEGYLALFFEADWTPVSYRDAPAAVREANAYFDHVSFGHDVETAYLMLEAAEALGLEPGPTLVAGKRMVDHALEHGYDRARGGFYDRGYYFAGETEPRIIQATKEWWVQAEGANTLLLMHDHFPADPADYGQRFLEVWRYCQTYLIDHRRGGWYRGGLDAEPDWRSAPKADLWKATYHDGRALMNLIRRLRSPSPSGHVAPSP